MNKLTLREFIIAVKESSAPIYKNFGQIIDYTKKSDNTPVTIVDTEINETLMNWARHRDNIGFVGEEGNGDIDKKYILLVDPLDGTNAFMRGMPTCTTIATLLEMDNAVGTPIIAIIHNPITNETWFARKNQGAYKIHVNDSESTISTKWGGGQMRTAICPWRNASHNLEEITQKIKSNHDFSDQQLGALGIGGGLIAQGTLDAIACGENSAAEIAAMSLIVREAGGVTIDLEGNPINDFTLGRWKGKEDFLLPYGAIIASNQTVANTLLAFIQENQ